MIDYAYLTQPAPRPRLTWADVLGVLVMAASLAVVW